MVVAGSLLTVALDVTSLIGPRTGVGALTENLVEGLAARSDVAVRAFAVTWRGRGALSHSLPSGVVLASRAMAARPLRAAWSRGDRPAIERWTGPVDVVHGPNFIVPPARHAARVVTVHDLTAWRYPELVDRHSASYPDMVAKAVAAGAWVHAPSRFVAGELADILGLDPARVVAVANGAPDLGPETPGRDVATGRTLAGAERYVLAVGTVEPRKDLPGLVAAFDRVAADDPDVRLVLAGPDGWGADALADAVAQARHGDRIIRLGWVDDDDRAALLRGATVVAYPSVYEGFGLVPLEAMAAGVPVVSTRAGAIPEVVGDAAELVEVGDTDALAEALGRLLGDEERRAELVAAGHLRRARFRWETTVDDIVALYRRAAEAR
ncbi:MAG TPA: glycosyltransferase family 1 protein [Iamia sp.]|jgi:glycosyltransferase involved in cell wall biosynthesis|nr:glycosyltransferase family 1 protein [Iamia sp.]